MLHWWAKTVFLRGNAIDDCNEAGQAGIFPPDGCGLMYVTPKTFADSHIASFSKITLVNYFCCYFPRNLLLTTRQNAMLFNQHTQFAPSNSDSYVWFALE